MSHEIPGNGGDGQASDQANKVGRAGAGTREDRVNFKARRSGQIRASHSQAPTPILAATPTQTADTNTHRSAVTVLVSATTRPRSSWAWSRTPLCRTQLGWANSTALVTSEADLPKDISALKQQDGGDIVVWGGASLARQLTRHELIDEYQLFIEPVALGGGDPLFTDADGWTPMSFPPFDGHPT